MGMSPFVPHATVGPSTGQYLVYNGPTFFLFPNGKPVPGHYFT